MLRRLTTGTICLLFIFGILTLGGLFTESVDAGHDKFKRVRWVVHYHDQHGDFCFKTVRVMLVPLPSPHRAKCHDPGGDREGCHQAHGKDILFDELVVDRITIPHCC